ncbi:MAG: hypothetical protein ACE5ED_02860 [Rhodothalassiaceae bacterium]
MLPCLKACRYGRHLFAASLIPSIGLSLPATAHDGHHDAGAALHFSHPIVVESPSPDTKLRLDYGFEGSDALDSHMARLEGEYAFAPWISVEVDLPWRRVKEAGGPARAHLDSGEVALKLVGFADPESGLLLGGGLEIGLPTGSTRKAIGSSREIEIEPFLDIGFKRGRFELVSFLRFGIPTNKPAEERDAEKLELGYSGSVLYHASPSVELLVEFEGSRIAAGEEQENSFLVAPGIKYRPFRQHALAIGASLRVPLDHERAFDIGPMISAFYHF